MVVQLNFTTHATTSPLLPSDNTSTTVNHYPQLQHQLVTYFHYLISSDRHHHDLTKLSYILKPASFTSSFSCGLRDNRSTRIPQNLGTHPYASHQHRNLSQNNVYAQYFSSCATSTQESVAPSTFVRNYQSCHH